MIDENSKSTDPISKCIICRSARLHYLFSVESYRAVRCDDCGLLMLKPQPSDEDLAKIYSASYFLDDSTDAGRQHVTELKEARADHYLDLLVKYFGDKIGRMLEIGCGQGEFLARALARGFDVTGIDYSADACNKTRQKLNGHGQIICGTIDTLGNEKELYDVCVLADVIEHVRDPRAFMCTVHQLLKPGGAIFIATPSLDAWSARLLKDKWMEFKPQHLFYFNEATLQSLLFHCGFGEMVLQPCTKALSIEYIAGHFERYPVRRLSSIVASVARVMPDRLKRKSIWIVASGMIVMARAQQKSYKRKLSIVVPVFNEVATVDSALNKLLAKQVEGLDIEIVVVESNSTDGTREIVLKYKDHPRVMVFLEDRPRGKGHAVRRALKCITGDFVMIQDADLEYDIEDYDVLLEPLMSGREAFVLGSRHGGRSWKIRHFSDQPLQGLILNLGHWGFTFLINVLFGLRLMDPFTMYKVFRRDCLYGLTFECNRFDFDFELLIKLVRKGYTPLEIPVNYRSRSFLQGKKVSVFRDPISWLWALMKYRFVRIDPVREVVRQRG